MPWAGKFYFQIGYITSQIKLSLNLQISGLTQFIHTFASVNVSFRLSFTGGYVFSHECECVV